jgi:hypothetical protein
LQINEDLVVLIREPLRGLLRNSAGKFIPRRRTRFDRARLGTLVGVVTVGSVVLCSCSPSEPPALPPRIAFEETTHDFGRAVLGVPVSYTFVFRNAGGLDLTIDNVRASCACTVTMPAPRVLHPDDDGTIVVSLDTSRDVGRKARTITVYSNDPAQPVTTLSLIGDVEAELAADPPALYVGHLRRNQVAQNEVHLLARDGVTVASVEGSGKVIDAILRTTPGGARLRVTIKPNAPPGRFKDTITVRTNSTRQPTLSIPVVGVVDAAGSEGHPAERPG